MERTNPRRVRDAQPVRAALYGLAARLAAERDPAAIRKILVEGDHAPRSPDDLIAPAGSAALAATLARVAGGDGTPARAWDAEARREILSLLGDAEPRQLGRAVEQRYLTAAAPRGLVDRRPPIPVGMVHGRFQPFHVGHAEYLRAAGELCGELYVGITNPDSEATLREAADDARHLPEANPFTYYERLAMVEAFAAEALPGHTVRVVPFPISQPERWPHYVPPGAVHFIRLRSAWGREKAARLESAGYEVRALGSGDRLDVSGTQVRHAWRAGAAWAQLVPAPVARVLRSLSAHRAQAADPAA